MCAIKKVALVELDKVHSMNTGDYEDNNMCFSTQTYAELSQPSSPQVFKSRRGNSRQSEIQKSHAVFWPSVIPRQPGERTTQQYAALPLSANGGIL
jgi:hypothetical protein